MLTATNLSNSYSNDMLTVKLSGFPDMHWRDLSRLQGGKLHIIILYSSTFYKKGHVIQRNLKIHNARVSRFVDWCAVLTLEPFSFVCCQSKEFDRVTDLLKHSLQTIVVYVKHLFIFQNDYKRLGHSVICSIDYWLLYVNRKLKWYELSGSEMSYRYQILYQSTLKCTLAKSFDISDVVDRLLESITPRKRQNSIGEFLCTIHFWTIWLQYLNHVSLLRKTASMHIIYCIVL
jgi:hypothetical protein